jgi:hypothetical protein
MLEDPGTYAKIFVSYSTLDRQEAENPCRALEQRKIHCWIAPRDVPSVVTQIQPMRVT